MAERCYLHKTRESTGTCGLCGRPICTRCTDFVGLAPSCPACREQVRTRSALRRGLKIGLFAALAATLLVGAVVAYARFAGARDERVHHLRAGDAALTDGAFDAARAEYEAVLAAFPEDPVATGRLGLAYLGLRNNERARPLLEKAVAAGSADPQVARELKELNSSERRRKQSLNDRHARVAREAAGVQEAQARLARARTEAETARLEAEAAQSRAQTEHFRAVAAQREATTEAMTAARVEAEARAADSEARKAESAARLEEAQAVDPACAVPVRRQGNRLLVAVEMDGWEADFVLDTGATGTVVTRAFADTAHLSVLEGRTVTAHTAGGETEYALAQVRRVAIAGRPVDDLIVAICDECALGEAYGLLGMDVLRPLDIRLDLPTGRAVFAHCSAE